MLKDYKSLGLTMEVKFGTNLIQNHIKQLTFLTARGRQQIEKAASRHNNDVQPQNTAQKVTKAAGELCHHHCQKATQPLDMT